MEIKEKGYSIPDYGRSVKRYCQLLDLKDDKDLIEKYKKAHSPECYWKEIGEGIRSVGILNMEIYILQNHLFMVVETPLDFQWDAAFQKLATLPRQEEWERYVAAFQDVQEVTTSTKKWQMMERMFSLKESMREDY